MQVWANLTKFSVRHHNIENCLVQFRGLKDITKNVLTDKPVQQITQTEKPENTIIQNQSILKKPISKRITVLITPVLTTVTQNPESNLKNDETKDIVRLRKVLPRDAPNVIKLFQKSFTKCEPFANCLDIPEKPLFCPILKEFWLNSIRQGMTYAAIPSNSVSIEYLYGAVLNTRLTQLEPDHWWLYSQCSNCPKTKNLLNLWSYLVKDSAIHEKCATKKILNISHVIINEEESKRLNPKFDKINISKILISKSFRIAQNKGYKMVSFMCSSDNMSEVAKQLKMEQIYEKPYKSIFDSILKSGFDKLLPKLSLKIFTKKIQ